MNKIICSLFIVFLLSVGHLYAGPVEILVAYESTPLPPYYFGDTVDIPEQPGIAVELLMLLDKQMPEIRITFRRAPWKRCLMELKIGRVNGIFPASFKPERREIGVYPTHNDQPDKTRALINLSYFLYALNDSPITWNGQQLVVDGTIGAPTSYSIVGDLKKMGHNVDDGARTTKKNLIKLQHKRVMAVAAQDVTADPLLESDNRFSDIVKLLPPLKTKPNYLMFSHQFVQQHPKLAERIWMTLKSVREEYLEQLSRKYTETQ
jgi:polar amino acid transport system substrate-binding protein